MTITGAPLQVSLPEGMQFATARHTEVVIQLSTLWAAVSLATQSILGHLLVDVSQAGVVGEMATSFQEWAEWCSHLETSGSRVCDLVLGPTDGQAHLVACREKAARQLQVMQDEHQPLQNLGIRVWNLVLERSGEVPSLAVVLSSTVDLIEGCVDAAATNRVHWGA
jgi:hypothetical protein